MPPVNHQRARFSPPKDNRVVIDTTPADSVLGDFYASSAFTPADLSPWLWLRANVGVYKDTAGAIVPNGGETIARWEDQSGNGRHFVQATANLRPQRVANDFNTSAPAVRFIEDYMTCASQSSGLTGSHSVYAIVKQNINPSQDQLFLRMRSFVIGQFFGANLQYYLDPEPFGGAGKNNSGRWFTGTGYRHYNVVNALINGGANQRVEFRLESTSVVEINASMGYDPAPDSHNTLAVGGRDNGTELAQDFSIVDVLVFDRALTYDEQLSLQQYYQGLSVTLPAAPTASFTRSPASGVAPLLVTFADTSTGSPTLWHWDFGDGTTSTLQNPTKTYNTPGTYDVILTASNAGGNSTATLQVTVTIAPPVAAFVGSPTSGLAPLTVNFTDQSTGSPTSWLWAFGDGVFDFAQNPAHTYNTPGTYTVTLLVANAGGDDTEIKTAYITVNAPPPVAGFSAVPTTGIAPLTVNFSNSSTNASSYLWNFGDGNTSTATSPSHTYNTPGTYTVTLTATGAGGVDTEQIGITVTASAPTAAFDATPLLGNAPLTVQFVDQSSGIPTGWTWDFGDGGTSTQQNPQYTFFTPGVYVTTLTATNSGGSSQAQRNIYVNNPPPVVSPPTVTQSEYSAPVDFSGRDDYRLLVFDPAYGGLLHIIDATQSYDVRFGIVLNDVGSLALTLPDSTAWDRIFTTNALIDVQRKHKGGTWTTLETYLCRLVQRYQDEAGDRFVVGGQSLAILASWHVIDPADDFSAVGGYSIKSGPADTVMYQFAYEQMGIGASPLRQRGELEIIPPPGTAQRVGKRVRYENLLEVMQELATRSGVDFRFTRTDGARKRLYIGRVGQDKSRGANFPHGAFVYLSPQRGNIQEASLVIDRKEEGNYCYILGQGQGNARVVLKLRGQGVYDAPGNRIEFKTENRRVEREDSLALLTSAQDALAERRPKVEFTFRMGSRAPGSVWGEDWDVGDTVTAAYGGYEQDARITSVEVSLSAGGESIDVKVENVE
ncbi:MAG: PKD domain-containing protein [Chloroflexota bacterium]|nr:PKD domain-containing protein [Chloroflexota bacterium]